MSNVLTDRPLVSVLVANYNYGRFLGDCINSVLAQTYQPVELIVVDDGSTDASRTVLEEYGPRIHTVLQDNQGQGAAFNAGFARSKGEIICLLDADDGWYPGKVESVVEVFRQHPQIQWVRHKFTMVNEQLEPLNSVVPAFIGSGEVQPHPLELVAGSLRAGTSLCMRRALAEKVFPVTVPPELALDADDTVLFVKVVERRATGYSIDKALGFYRRHGATRFNDHDLPHLLRREARLSAALARYFGYATPVSTYKLETIVAALEGAPWWSSRRSMNYLRGLRSTVRVRSRSRVLIRQLASLTLAYVAPRMWVRSLFDRARDT